MRRRQRRRRRQATISISKTDFENAEQRVPCAHAKKNHAADSSQRKYVHTSVVAFFLRFSFATTKKKCNWSARKLTHTWRRGEKFFAVFFHVIEIETKRVFFFNPSRHLKIHTTNTLFFCYSYDEQNDRKRKKNAE